MGVENVTLREHSTLREVLAYIEAGGIQLAVVVDADGRLIGAATDGDVRRAMLAGADLDSAAANWINRSPLTVLQGSSDQEILERMKQGGIHQIIVVDAERRVVDLKYLDQLIRAPDRPNPVVLMVGGLGTRLGELTRNVPKPMLPVGGRPMLEIIIEGFVQQGFRDIKLAVNFGSHVIEDHFGDGLRHGCRIEYLRESKRMGTAGGLSLLSEISEHPTIVSNGDLLLRLDYQTLVQHHEATGSAATMAVREFTYQVPYGVIQTQDGLIVELEEKPVQRHMISGGLYVLSPDAVRRVPQDSFYDITTLFGELASLGERASVFPIDGYWLDIGRSTDYEQAQIDYPRLVHSGQWGH